MVKVLKLTKHQEIEIPIERIEKDWKEYNDECLAYDDEDSVITTLEDYVENVIEDYLADFDQVIYDYAEIAKGLKDNRKYEIVEEGE